MAIQRRIVAREKTHLDQDEKPTETSIAPAVPTSVIAKLLGFTFAMVILPISTYFFTRDLVFQGNSTYAGATAAIMANVILIGYVIVAFKEDQSDRKEALESEKRKSK